MIAVAVGHVTHDRRGAALVPGGSAWYAARAWAAAGLAPRMVTCVGEDFLHDEALRGLGATVARGGATTLFTNEYPAEGPRRQRVEAVAPEVRPPAGLRADLLLLAPVIGEVSLEAWRAVGGYRVCGLQGWLKRREGERVWSSTAGIDPRAFAGSDAACLSEEDLGGDLEWLGALRAAVPVVALTLGGAGCEVFHGEEQARITVEPVAAPDPTGAGDTFAAGFALALARGAPPVVAGRAGCDAARALLLAAGAC